MTGTDRQDAGFISSRVAMALLVLAAISSVILLLLFAFGPELRKQESTGTDVMSVSAVGFAGLKELLGDSGIPSAINRGADGGAASLTILTPTIATTPGELRDYRIAGPVLIILPKWDAVPMPDHPQWVQKFGGNNPVPMQRMLRPLAGDVTVVRVPGTAKDLELLKGAEAPASIPGPLSLPHIEEVQSIGGVIPLMIARRYGPLLAQARRKGDPVYILSEPDLMNNHGLGDDDTALTAIDIIRALRRGNGPVAFDVSLNGLGATPSLWPALFAPPFLGATLCAFLAALLIGLHAVSRFGAPLPTARVFANGKKALADNTAALIRMMRRERGMAQRYVAAARETALARLDLKRAMPEEQARLLTAFENSAGLGISFAELTREADATRNGSDLLRVARKTYAWKQGVIGGH
jgi:hypothetical protein